MLRCFASILMAQAVWGSAAASANPPNPYCVTGAHWGPGGLMQVLNMPGGRDDLNGPLGYSWGSFSPHTRVALTNPSWRWTTFDRKPPFHSYDVENDQIVDPAKTREWIAKHPGWIYIIGNEPDNPALDAGDGMTTEQYARMYHRYHTFIKEIDPKATLVVGAPYAASFKSEVQADAKWWRQVLDYYKKQYGQDMPVDVWNCHCYTPPGRLDADRIIQEFFIPYRMFVDTVSDGIYRDKPLWCTEFGIALWSGAATGQRMAEFIEQLCPRLERSYELPSGQTKRVCNRFFWFLGPWSKEWRTSALATKDRKTPTATGKVYSRLANGYPNPVPPVPENPPLAAEPVRFSFDSPGDEWYPMGGEWIVEDGAYNEKSLDSGWGTRSHLRKWYRDVHIECDVRINATEEPKHWAGVRLRHSTIWSGGIGGYLVYIRQNGEVGLARDGQKEAAASRAGVISDTGAFHRLAIDAIGPTIEVSVDGQTVFRWTDENPARSSGLVSLETGKSDASFDNVRVAPVTRSPTTSMPSK